MISSVTPVNVKSRKLSQISLVDDEIPKVVAAYMEEDVLQSQKKLVTAIKKTAIKKKPVMIY